MGYDIFFLIVVKDVYELFSSYNFMTIKNEFIKRNDPMMEKAKSF